MSLFWFGQGVIWVGILFLFLCFCISLFWHGQLSLVLNQGQLNQGQLSIVVSDWEPYVDSFFPTGFLWVVNFCLVLAPYRTVLVILLFTFVLVFSFNKTSMNTYHTALCSDDSSSSDDEYRYIVSTLFVSSNSICSDNQPVKEPARHCMITLMVVLADCSQQQRTHSFYMLQPLAPCQCLCVPVKPLVTQPLQEGVWPMVVDGDEN